MKKEVAEAAGIDLKAGMRAFGNNKIIYDRMLLGFPKDTHMQEAKEAFQNGNLALTCENISSLEKLTKKMGMTEYAKVCSEFLKVANVENAEQEHMEQLAILMNQAQLLQEKVMGAFS